MRKRSRHRVILRVISYSRLEQGHNDDRHDPVSTLPGCWRNSRLTGHRVAPVGEHAGRSWSELGLLLELLQMFINTFVVGGSLWYRVRHRLRGAGQAPQRLPVSRLRHLAGNCRCGGPQAALERRRLAVQTLTSVVATLILARRQVRRRMDTVQSLRITGSKSQVSDVDTELDAHIEQFSTRSFSKVASSRSWPPTRSAQGPRGRVAPVQCPGRDRGERRRTSRDPRAADHHRRRRR